MNARNIPYLTRIIGALRSVDPSRLAAEEVSYGICLAVHQYVRGQALQTRSQVAATIDLWYAEKDAILRRWDKFSGDTVYPVPSDVAGGCPLRTFMEHQLNGTLWHGRQGELRRDLLAHLIDGFERLLSKAQQEAL